MNPRLFLLSLLLWPVAAYCQSVVTVTPGQNLAAIVQSQRPGTVVRLSEGVFEHEDINVPIGVSLQGSGVDKTVLRPRNFSWWRASVLLHSATTTAGNQSISGITFDGNPQRAFMGVGIHNRTDIKIFDVRINRYYRSGLSIMGGPGEKSANIEVYNFTITESAHESTAGSYGNIMIDGNAENLYIHDGQIDALTNVPADTYGNRTGGYAVKARPYYAGSTEHIGTVKNSRFYRLKIRTKPTAAWDNYRAPNISFEFWRSRGENVEIAYCDDPDFPISSHLSLEYNYPNAPPVTFNVHHNRFRINLQQVAEMAVDNVVFSDNEIFAENTPNAWCLFFNSNPSTQPVKGLRIVRNKIHLGANSPAFYVSYNPLQDVLFAENQVTGTAKPTLLQLRTTRSAGSRDIRFLSNSFQSGYSELSLTEGAAARPENLTVSASTAPVALPNTAPAVRVDTVYLDRVLVKTDTVYRYKTDTIRVYLPAPYPVYYDPVLHYDSTSGQYIIRRQIRK